MERRRRVTISTKAVLFDLDGTLIHSAPDLHQAANVVCRARGWEEFDLDTIISFIGHGVPHLVAQMFGARDASIEEADYQTAVMDFLAFYEAHATDLTKPYEGIVEALDWLQANNIPTAMVTNKPHAPALKILQEMDLIKYFPVLIGGDTTPEKKPNAAPYLAACEQLGVKVADTIYIGDSETDGKTASGVSVPFVLFTGGYRNATIDEIPHWQAIDHFSELVNALQQPIA